MSFYNGQLRVKVQDREINAATLKSYMERIHNKRPGATKGTYGNYLALTRTEGVYTYSMDFHGMGILELRLLVDPNEKLDRKVLIVRKAGMKLFRLGNISKLVNDRQRHHLRDSFMEKVMRGIAHQLQRRERWETPENLV